MVTKTRKNLKMHKKLLLDVINRQAGSLHKAVLEGVMNGIEAGANKIDIYFDEEKNILTIKDDGQGIKTVEDIERFFETFGQPHDDNENKIWAQFRMGRGQLFAFGKNYWRTGQFGMNVDIDGMGLDYDLEENLDDIDGCNISIELYTNPIGYSYQSVEAFKNQIKEQVEFMETPIYFNGEKLNCPANKLNWQLEDDNAYYRFDIGTDLTIYNLGAFVMKISSYQCGVTGTIVSKKQLKVNFARNDIQSDCPIYEEIKKIINENRRKKIRKRRKNLSDGERTAILCDLRDGGVNLTEVNSACLIPLAIGRYIKLSDVLRNRLRWSFSEKDNIKADRLIQKDEAIVFDRAVLDDLRYNGDESKFFSWLIKNGIYNSCGTLSKWEKIEAFYVPFDELTEALNDSFSILPDNKLSVKEKCILRTLDSYDRCWEGRTICIGISNTARAWTDGNNYIAIDRNFLKSLYLPSANSSAILVNVMVHELAHDEDTSGTHIHGPDFYRRFHDLCVRSNNPVQRIIADFHKKLTKSKFMYRQEKEIKKQTKAQQKRNNVLGIAASI